MESRARKATGRLRAGIKTREENFYTTDTPSIANFARYTNKMYCVKC